MDFNEDIIHLEINQCALEYACYDSLFISRNYPELTDVTFDYINAVIDNPLQRIELRTQYFPGIVFPE